MQEDVRALPRRQVYLGEGLTFEVGGVKAEAIDVTPLGLGLVLTGGSASFASGDAVSVRYTGRGGSGEAHEAVVRHAGTLRSGARILPRLGVSLTYRPPSRDGFACPDRLPAFASADCPWFFQERLRFRIMRIGAGGMVVRAPASTPLLPQAELDFELQLASVGAERVRGRVTSLRWRGADVKAGVSWTDPPHKAISRYLLAGDETLTPAALRAAGLRVGSLGDQVGYDYASSAADYDEILALRLLAHQAEGHLQDATVADMRSPFDAHSRHLTCRFGGRIVGYVRVIFVDRVPERSQYVSYGGHEVPRWLWEAGFVEAGAGAMHPDFQRSGLFVPLMQHSLRVAVQSGHRYVLGACDDDLLGMYQEMGFQILEQRIVEPKPGWRFRSHLIYVDAERLLSEPPATRTVAAMASAIAFAA